MYNSKYVQQKHSIQQTPEPLSYVAGLILTIDVLLFESLDFLLFEHTNGFQIIAHIKQPINGPTIGFRHGQHQFLMSRYNNIYRFHPFYLNPRNIIILTLSLRWLVECRLQEYRSGINTNMFTSEGKNHFMFFLIIISIGYNMDQC